MVFFKNVVTPTIMKLLYENQGVFIQLIDKIENGKEKKIFFYQVGDKIENGYFFSSNNNIYTSSIKLEFILETTKFIEKNFRLNSIYGDSETLNLIKKYLRMKIKTEYNYYLMLLPRSSMLAVEKKITPANIHFCNENDFHSLKVLQKAFHKEEVYAGTSFYPEQAEMSAFHKTLRTRANCALFINGIPVSKCYVSAESRSTYQLGGIYTQKEFRSNGYSYSCLAYLINKLFKRNSKKIFFQLFVKIENKPAIKLYRNLGFGVIGKTSCFYF